jgi:plasmid stability protein
MSERRRPAVSIDPELHRALRVKAAAADRTISDIVDEALRVSLAEDVEDLEAVEARRQEPELDFEEVVKEPRTIKLNALLPR